MKPSGDQLKMEGMAMAEEAVPKWSDLALQTIRDLANTGRPFTSEDVTERIGLPRGGVATNRNNAVGAAMSGAARRGIIRKTGYRNATRPELHSAVVAVWIGARWPR